MQTFVLLRAFSVSILFLQLALPGGAQSLSSHNPELSAGSTSTTSAAKDTSRVSQYPVGIADVLHVNVWRNPELSQTVTVGPDGYVSLSLLGDVYVAGSTTSELGTLLTNSLAALMLTPQVTVSVVEIHSRQVFILGQVVRPGGFPMIGQLSVIQVLAQAGGFNPFAKRNRMYVLRANNKGSMERLAYNYSDVIHGKNKQNFELQPGDTVIVP